MLIKIGVGDRSHAQILGKKLILNNIERTSKIRTSQKEWRIKFTKIAKQS